MCLFIELNFNSILDLRYIKVYGLILAKEKFRFIHGLYKVISWLWVVKRTTHMRSSKLQEVAIVFHVGGNEEYILYCCNGEQTITDNAYKIFWQWVVFVME